MNFWMFAKSAVFPTRASNRIALFKESSLSSLLNQRILSKLLVPAKSTHQRLCIKSFVTSNAAAFESFLIAAGLVAVARTKSFVRLHLSSLSVNFSSRRYSLNLRPKAKFKAQPFSASDPQSAQHKRCFSRPVSAPCMRLANAFTFAAFNKAFCKSSGCFAFLRL